MSSTTSEAPPSSSDTDVDVDTDQVLTKAEAAVAAASQPGASRTLTEQQLESATDWFLSDQQEAPTILQFRVNIASAGLPARWIKWGCRALTRQEIKDIRRDARDSSGQEDDMEVNMRVLIRSAVEPNLIEIANQRGLADPADLVNQRFAHKPGLIEAVARKANEMSGYGANTDLIQPIEAAGN